MFFWSTGESLDQVVGEELPALTMLDGDMRRRNLAGFDEESGAPTRNKVAGYEVPAIEAVRLLSSLPTDAAVSDSIRCWAYSSKLALELAAAQRVVPTVASLDARWRALLTRQQDQERFERLTAALPLSCRAVPSKDRGAIRLYTASHAVRSFIDAIVDQIYRQEAYPGTARGWALEFANALTGQNPAFRPRDARSQGIPEALTSWSAGNEGMGLRLGMQLRLPESANGPFTLEYFLRPSDRPAETITLHEAWMAGDAINIGDRTYMHPAHAAMRGLARASRIFPHLLQSLSGKSPRALRWTPHEAWEFLDTGAELLRSAGFDVRVPEEFETAGRHRIRARMKLTGPEDDTIDLGDLLTFQWEVTLGDLVLSGTDFAELLDKREPVVQFRGEWVILDPQELNKLPKGLPQEGSLPKSEALRAVLTGQYQGIPVVADSRLERVLEILRTPPEREVPEELVGTLRPYQRTGFAWLATLGDMGLGACLADDMGLGKTIQLITHLLDRKARGKASHPSLVVCPTSVLGNWSRELRRFGPSLKVHSHHGQQRDVSQLGNYDVVLTTYGLLVRDHETLCARPWDVVTLDEAQSIKNPDSMRAKAARKLNARHRIALSGTPVENRLEELWSLMEFLMPGLLGQRATFRRNVAVPVERYGDQDIASALKRGVAPFLLRRLKTDESIVQDLPDKIERRDFVALTTEQAKLYRRVVDEHMNKIQQSQDIERRGQVLAMLTALKQVCNHPAQLLKDGQHTQKRSGKLQRLVELLDSILDLREQALIFTQYREMGELLQAALLELYGEQPPFLHGGTLPNQRDEMVRAFQEDDDAPPILLISLRAGGTGLNLTAASHVIHYDRWWNPAVEDQATDRAYRIGQRSNVQVHKLIAQGSLEERIDQMLEDKRALAESVVGSGERWVAELDDDALRDLVTLGEDALVEDDA